MTGYIVSCDIPGITPLQTMLLEQAGCHILDNTIEFNLQRLEQESSDEFRERAGRWMNRELSRLNVLTGKLLKYKSLNIDPTPGRTTITAAAAWGHAMQSPPRHVGWSNEGIEFRLSAWDVASHTDDHVLRFMMLDSICESAGVSQSWVNKDNWPPRFAEIRLIRNLLVHGSQHPNMEVKKYLDACTRSIADNRFTNRHKHINLARLRSPHLTLAVWNIVINDCVEDEVELFCEEPASLRGWAVLAQGPHPATNR